MLQIRKAQLDVLRRHMDRRTVEWLTQQLYVEYPHKLPTLDDARGQAELTIRKADRANVDEDNEILELARLMMRFGNDLEDFPDPEWAGEILAHPALPESLKLEFLRARLEPRVEVSDDEEGA